MFRNVEFAAARAVGKIISILSMRFRQSLFWDVEPKTLNPRKHRKYIIERILQYGNDREVRWLVNQYSRRQLREVACGSRVLDPKTRALWQLFTKS